MKNPNGPSIEEMEEWSDALRDQEEEKAMTEPQTIEELIAHWREQANSALERFYRRREGERHYSLWGIARAYEKAAVELEAVLAREKARKEQITARLEAAMKERKE